MRWAGAIAIAGACILAAPVPAVASSVSADDGTLHYGADDGEVNDAYVETAVRVGELMSVHDRGATIRAHPGSRCVAALTYGYCLRTAPWQAEVFLGDRDDRLVVDNALALGGPGDDTMTMTRGGELFGGPGSDRLTGGPLRDSISGEGTVEEGVPGSDVVRAGGGDDRVWVDDGLVDQVECGAGLDTVTADELDVVAADCEQVTR
jgi:hypothetical protein